MKSITTCIIILLSLSTSLAQYQQIYFQEDFTACSLPNGWHTSKQNPLSHGWQIGDSATLSTSRMPVPDNGGCFAVMNDGNIGNPAAKDILITPSMDLSGAMAPVIMFDLFAPAGGWFTVEMIRPDHANVTIMNTFPFFFFERRWQKFEYPMNHLTGGRTDVSFRFIFEDWGWDYQGVAIDNFKVVDPLADDLAVTYLEPIHHYKVGSYPLIGRLRNKGSNAVNSYNINWQIDNGQIQRQQFSNSFQIGFFRAFDLPNALTFSNPGKYLLKVWTSVPNGRQDAFLANDTLVQAIQVVNDLPPKRVLVEKYGHTTCGPCYSVNQEFKQMLAARPETAVGISIQKSAADPMTTAEGIILDSVFVPAHPNLTVDRFKFIHNPSIAIHKALDVIDEVDTRVTWGEAVEVTIENALFNPVTREVSLDAVATFYGDYDMPLALNVAVIEDSILGYQTSAPDPNNYWHMQVLRKMLGGPWGDNSSFPARVQAGQRILQSFSYVLPATFKAKDVKVIAFLQRQAENVLEKEVLNTTKAQEIINFTNDMAEALPTGLRIFPNPARDIVFIESNTNEAISVTIMDLQGKKIRQSKQGDEQIDISSFIPGMYMLAIQYQGKTYFQKLFIR